MLEPLLHEKLRPFFDRLVNVTVEVQNHGADGGANVGSGAVITECGLIITAAHVVKRSRVVIVRRLRLEKKRWRMRAYGKYKADVIYRDNRTDIAVLKLRQPPEGLKAVVLGNSDAVKVGWPLYRVGRDRIPLGAGYVIRIVPYRRRMKEFYVGMDANLAASGGPVCNDSAELVGICLESEKCDNLPPAAFALTMADIRHRVLRRKEIRECLDPETADKICGPP